MKVRNWREKCKNRRLWNEIVKQAKTHQGWQRRLKKKKKMQKRKVLSRVYISQQIAPIPNQINPMNALSFYFFKIHFDVILPSRPRSSKGSLSLEFPPPPPKALFAPLFSAICDTSSSFLILLYLITRMTLEHSANHAPPHPAVSSGVSPRPPQAHYLPYHPIVEHPLPTFCEQYERPSFTPI